MSSKERGQKKEGKDFDHTPITVRGLSEGAYNAIKARKRKIEDETGRSVGFGRTVAIMLDEFVKLHSDDK